MSRTACLLVGVLLGCGPMAVPHVGADASTSTTTGTHDETADSEPTSGSLAGCTLPTSAQEGGSGGLDERECIAVAWTPVEGPGFSSDYGFGCEGMPETAVFENVAHVAAHHELWCELEQICRSPPPECPPPPELPQRGERILFMLASGSGCSHSVRIDAILDCGDRIEVHYGFGGIIGCDAFAYAFASAAIPCGPAPVVFIPS